MYRFRSLDNLLGKRKELEKQEIYFSSLDQLNDPMEGYREYYWKGDEIIWMNLFKHYILCLEQIITMCRLCNDEEKELYQTIPIYLTINDLPTDFYRDRIKRINKLFFKDEFIQYFIKVVFYNPFNVYKEELYLYLRIIHNRVIEVIREIDIQDGIIDDKESILKELNKYNYKNIDIKEFWNEANETQYRELFIHLSNISKELNMQGLMKMVDKPKMKTILIDFPELYTNQILKLVYPNTYVACFMKDYKDSSIWGTYGDSHVGVCLKFKTDILHPKLKLKIISSWNASSGYRYEFRDFELKPIIYTNKVYELDFFTNLGKLSMPKIQEWYSGDNGEVSVCANSLHKNKDKWRKNHWEQFEPSLLRKLPDWENENEYRILLTSILDSYEDPGERLLKYDFNDLDTLIFGIKTPMEKRLEIIDIITNKCKENNRKGFDFYEMYYSNSKKCLESKKIYSIVLE